MNTLTKVCAGHYTFGEYEIKKEAGRWSVLKDGHGVSWAHSLRKGAEIADRLSQASSKADEIMAADADLQEAFKSDHHLIKSIQASFEKWGTISEKQRALVLKIAADSKQKRSNAPIGEAHVLGKVLNLKEKWSAAWGFSMKMTVELANGARVWGTKPASHDVEEGDIVSFCSKNFTRSNDASFGFYSRPTQFQVNAPRDRIDWMYQNKDLDFDIYEAAILAIVGDDPASFEFGEVSLIDDTFVVEFDDGREKMLL